MEFEMKAITPAERMYTYAQSQQISMQTGFIGYLRADLGSTGKEFFSTWNDFRKDLKTDGFKAEFDEVINTLRDDILKEHTALLKYCNTHSDCSYGNDREYGVTVRTENYAYLMRLNPNKGEYNLYCYCYRKDWLDEHLRKAERGVRFIDPNYKEIFRIPDGDKIRITTSDGEKFDRICRYIDDYHVEVGKNLFHICEFAERMEQARNTVIPLRSSLPDFCYTILPSNGNLIIIRKGESGYTDVIDKHNSREKNRELADGHNSEMGISKAQEEAMLAGSMFGWNIKAADPTNYDENGTPIKIRQRDRGDAR